MILTVTLNACLDHVLFVQGLRPHDTNRIDRIETDAGGKGINVARVGTEMGAAVRATGFLGGATGAAIREVMHAQGVDNNFVCTEFETRQNFSVEDGSGRPPTTFNARGSQISGLEWELLLTTVADMAREAVWVVLGGSIPPGCPPNAYQILGDLAHSHHARVVLDADKDAMVFGMAAAPELIKPNVSEASRLLQRELLTEKDVVNGAKSLFDQLVERGSVAPWVVISRGADGAVMAGNFGILIGEPVAVDSKSTIGSGDSMIAGLLYGQLKGLTPEESLRWGLASGAATAATDGTEIGRLPVIRECFDRAVVRRYDG